MTGFELATVEQVCERNAPRGASPAAVRAVLQGLGPAIAYTLGGAPDDGLVALNTPLLGFEPLAELLGWFSPPLVNDALLELAGGDPLLLMTALDAMGLWARTGDAWERMQAALAEEGGA